MTANQSFEPTPQSGAAQFHRWAAGVGKRQIVNFRYYIHPQTEVPHIYAHEVAEVEVEEVLSHPGEDRLGGMGLE